MKNLARLGSVCVVALPLIACGGREIFDFPEDETGVASDTAVTSDSPVYDDTAVIPGEDAPLPWDDGPIPVDDTSVIPIEDTGVIPIEDTGVVPIDTGVIDTSPPPDGSTPIATACSKIAKSACTPAFGKCCAAYGFMYDSLACDDVLHAWCNSGADGVYAGKTSYNPAFADACAAGWANNTNACAPHMFDWVKNQAACSQMFNGAVGVGGVCSNQFDCRAAPGEVAYCDETAKRCRTVAVVGAGQSCTYFGAAIRWCDRGLTCDPSTARCVTATPIGGTCFGADDTACGIGNVCRFGKCAVGASVGSSCTRDMECASWSCEVGRCTDIRYTVPTRTLCSGF